MSDGAEKEKERERERENAERETDRARPARSRRVGEMSCGLREV